MSHLSELLAQRTYVRFLLARLSGLTAKQMLMVALFDLATVMVALVSGLGAARSPQRGARPALSG